ncbi:MAG: DUF4382 domain-containing protein, partial [Candidatus Heimdallarchaeota archaeon]|nr:DUF4382 domain-containing protein [Candidatus Heimdallarchaeota archaeon]
MKNKISILLSLLISFVMAAGLLSCGSGGSSGGDGPGTGSVALLLTDSSSNDISAASLEADNISLVSSDIADDFSEINLTIRKIELLSDNGHVTIFSEDNEANYIHLDLLDLKKENNETFLITLKHNVPAGTYNKIRLTITKIVLVAKNGDVFSSDDDVKILANGKVDLNPRRQFTVHPGKTLTLQIDPQENAIKVIENGKGYQLRPEVFVDIVDFVKIRKFIRMTGIVSNKDDEKFKLCSLVRDHYNDTDSDYDNNHHMARDICIYVYFSDNTSFFRASDGEPVEAVADNDI